MINDLNPLGNWLVNTYNKYDGSANALVSSSRVGQNVRKIILYNRHKHEIEERASSLFKPTVGTVIHKETLDEMQLQYPDELIIERRFKTILNNELLEGTPDIYAKVDVPSLGLLQGDIVDLKCVNVGTWLYDETDFHHYAWQLASNGLLLTANGLPIRRHILWFVFTDWTPYQSQKNEEKDWPSGRSYPKPSELLMPIQIFDDVIVENKVDEIISHKDTPDDELPECNYLDTWETKPWKVYAYTKAGKIRSKCMAGGSFWNRGDAEVFAHSKPVRCTVLYKPELERRGCKLCFVRKFCNKYKEVSNEKNRD